MKDKANATLNDLRLKAEEILNKKSINTAENNSDVDFVKIVHELELHQIELEVQNEELNLANIKAETEAYKYTSLYDFATCGYFTLSKKDEILELNFIGAAILGKERSQLLNKRFAFFIANETKPTFSLFLEKIFESKSRQTCEIMLSSASKISTYVYLTGIANEGGEQCFLTAIDITERKLAEVKLRNEKERIRTILELVRSPIFLKDNDHKISYANGAFYNLFCLTEKQVIGKTLAENVPENEKKHFLKIDRNVLDTGIPDIREEKLTVKGIVHTIITSKTRFIDAAGNKSLVGSIYDITELKMAEAKLIDNEHFLNQTQSIAKLGSYCLDFNSGKWTSSAILDNIFGIETHFERTIDGWISIIHPEWRTIMKEYLNNEVIGKKINFNKEYKIIKINTKEERWVHGMSEITLNNEGQPILLIGSVQDITERKQAEENLKESNRFALATLDALSDNIAILDENGFILSVNAAWRNFRKANSNSSCEVNPIEGQNYLTVCENSIGPDSVEAPAMTAGIHSVMNGERDEFSLEYPCHSPTEKRWFNARVTRFMRKGDLRIVVAHENITQRKLAEESLVASEHFLNQTQTIANIGSYSLDINSRKWTSTTVIDKIFGIDTHFEKTLENWITIVHPDWKKIMNDYMNEEVIAKEMSFNKEYKIITLDNKEERWVHGMGELIFDKEKRPIQLIGTIQDISERKIAEKSLRENEEKYRSLVENSPDGIVIYIDDKIAFINDEGLRMLGANNKEEIIGKPVLQFIHPDSLADVIQRMQEVVLDDNASAIVEVKFLDINAVPFDAEIKAIPTIYEHKAGIQVIVHDITKRKQSALELNKINRVYALISQINNLIIRTHSQEELFQEICNIAVNFGKFRMSWIGLLDDNQNIFTTAFAGFEKGYFTKSNKTTIADKPEGRGPTGTAMREGRTVICNNIANDITMEPWREAALERGYSSSISIPIIIRNKIIGSFNLYSEETNFFSSEEEISLLEKIILNISFALEKIQIAEEQKRTEEKIRQLSRAVEQSPVSIIITNTKGEIEYANPKFVETTGYTLEEVINQNPSVLIPNYSSPEEYKELWQTLTDGKEWHGEFQNKKKDGSLYWESVSISPIVNLEGKTTHYIAIKEDITHRKNVEKQLVKSKERAEESDRLKLAFLANMSHEIRTPMNGILGFTELLKAPQLSGEEQKEYIRIIEHSGRRMLNIINDIISISKVESGQIEVSLSKTNINEQIKYIHNFFKPEAKQKGIQLIISKLLSPKDTLIKTDREKVYAVLTNLVKNALKFTNEGSIELGCERKGEYLKFFIKDTGMGISKSQKKIVFERFRQANESINRPHEGSGLGLSISKAYVEMLEGKIWVESQERKGSTFYFTIPFHSEYKPEEQNSVKKAGSGEKEENKIKDLKVLIVDDDAISKLLITIAVKPYSKEILKVSTGVEAIEACRKNPDIDLVMMDINMPEMGGYEATKLIREFNKDLVIIAQTANGMQIDRDNATAAGCTDYISKPINISSLAELIQKYFEK